MISEQVSPLRNWTGWTDNLEKIVHVYMIESHWVNEDQVTEQIESIFRNVQTRCNLFNNAGHKLDLFIQVFAIGLGDTI